MLAEIVSERACSFISSYTIPIEQNIPLFKMIYLRCLVSHHRCANFTTPLEPRLDDAELHGCCNSPGVPRVYILSISNSLRW